MASITIHNMWKEENKLAADKKETIFDYAIEQARSSQDFITIGTTDTFQWIVCADGHGLGKNKNTVINILRSIKWGDMLKNKNFYESINMMMVDAGDTFGTGSTLSIVKIHETYFECFWIGDSTIKIYDNDKCIWSMENHNITNPKEEERIKKLGVVLESDYAPYILSPLKIEMNRAYYYRWGLEKINMTHALGHNQITGQFIDSNIIPRKKECSYKVIVATDGFWDMIGAFDLEILKDKTKKSEDLIQVVNNRWRQSWDYEGTATKFPIDNIDDVAIAVWTC